MPQGWSIRKLSRFNLPLSGGYGNRPEPTGHATYPQPLVPILIENPENLALIFMYRQTFARLVNFSPDQESD